MDEIELETGIGLGIGIGTLNKIRVLLRSVKNAKEGKPRPPQYVPSRPLLDQTVHGRVHSSLGMTLGMCKQPKNTML